MSDPEKRPQFDVPHHEGHLETSAGSLYYREFGDGDEVLVGLHGGPGGSQDYLAPLVDLAGEDLTLLLYDQYGCGRSDRPAEGDFDEYTVAAYRDRLDEVRQAVGAERLHLYGHSWGGWLALAYALAFPDRVAGLVLANTAADAMAAAESMREAARETLSPEEWEEFEDLLEDGAFDDDRFEEFDDRIWAERVDRSDADTDEFSAPTNMDIYGLMWGPSEFVVAETARLRGWSVADRLHEITRPTLVLAGEHDEIDPDLGRALANGIENARFHEFDGASHLALWEVRTRHAEVVKEFLDGIS